MVMGHLDTFVADVKQQPSQLKHRFVNLVTEIVSSLSVSGSTGLV